ncbi:MAG: hypothetical protein JWM74_3635 [Myxococcaceae bacterium]|jgi:uncharacterized protein YndB with AHSA1/START domain|nr:hypothetical protein [Myxococcaceae bacterium]
MKLIKKIGIGVGAVVVVFVLVVATRPSAFHIERSITMAAHPESAFAQVNDFHAWPTWSPYEKMDPEMKRSYEGAASGTGAIYMWSGDGKAGEGKMTIEKSDKPSLVAIKLEFTKPFQATNAATFTFVPVAEGTKVTWAMDGQNNFVGKAFSLFMDMDKLVGSDFERGLAAMKANAESAPKPTTEAAK